MCLWEAIELGSLIHFTWIFELIQYNINTKFYRDLNVSVPSIITTLQILFISSCNRIKSEHFIICKVYAYTAHRKCRTHRASEQGREIER